MSAPNLPAHPRHDVEHTVGRIDGLVHSTHAAPSPKRTPARAVAELNEAASEAGLAVERMEAAVATSADAVEKEQS
jgi:hypothetical protein